MATAHARLMALAFAMATTHASFAMTFAGHFAILAVLAIPVTALAILAIPVTVQTVDTGLGNFGVGDTDVIRWRIYSLAACIDC